MVLEKYYFFGDKIFIFVLSICGSSSVVEHQLPKLRVGSSILLSRSIVERDFSYSED